MEWVLLGLPVLLLVIIVVVLLPIVGIVALIMSAVWVLWAGLLAISKWIGG